MIWFPNAPDIIATLTIQNWISYWAHNMVGFAWFPSSMCVCVCARKFLCERTFVFVAIIVLPTLASVFLFLPFSSSSSSSIFFATLHFIIIIIIVLYTSLHSFEMNIFPLFYGHFVHFAILVFCFHFYVYLTYSYFFIQFVFAERRICIFNVRVLMLLILSEYVYECWSDYLPVECSILCIFLFHFVFVIFIAMSEYPFSIVPIDLSFLSLIRSRFPFSISFAQLFYYYCCWWSYFPAHCAHAYCSHRWRHKREEENRNWMKKVWVKSTIAECKKKLIGYIAWDEVLVLM